MRRVGVDVGGTFTDITLWNEDRREIVVHKLPSTPTDPAQAMMAGLGEITDRVGTTLEGIDHLLHGTTIATNTVLEKNGSRVGLITTEGFRDIIHIGRHRRPYNFSIYFDPPWRTPPLVERRDRLTVRERVVGPTGEVLLPLDEDDVRRAARALREAEVDAVAVCFLFSFLNPAHEDRAAEIVREEFPDVHVSVGHRVVPLHREYERFSTACLNGYIGPRTSQYLENMRDALTRDAPGADFNLMTSNGGIVTVEDAIERPVSLLMSGPVAGVIGGIWVGGLVGHSSVITLDVGGTSADIGVAPDGQLRMKRLYDTEIGGYEVMLPMVDMDTIGAGGGSIARVDAGGLLRVGPQSAGADPGPACYGRGGATATATDAQVVLGRVRSETFLGGRMALHTDEAEAAIDRDLVGKVAPTRVEAAMGVVRILNHNMVRAIELNSVRKGFDPRSFSLVAFGGAGPLWACDIAQELSIPWVIVPRHPGITSALGLLATNLKYEFSRTVMVEAREVDADFLEGVFAELESRARAELAAADVPAGEMELQRWADCRYTGQAYELLVRLGNGKITPESLAELENAFYEQHEREYFWRFTSEKPVQLVHVRVYGVGEMPELTLSEIEAGEEEPAADAVAAVRDVAFLVDDRVESLSTTFYSAENLRARNVVAGPAIVEHEDSTTVINPGLTATVDHYGTLVIDCRGRDE